jgi:hypothetical protein
MDIASTKSIHIFTMKPTHAYHIRKTRPRGTFTPIYPAPDDEVSPETNHAVMLMRQAIDAYVSGQPGNGEPLGGGSSEYYEDLEEEDLSFFMTPKVTQPDAR